MPYTDFAKWAFSDAMGKGIAGLPSPTPSESWSNSTLQPSEDAATTLSPMPSDSNMSLLPLINQMASFNDQQYDFFSGLHIPGPKSLFENDEPILPMPEGYTAPSTAQSLFSLELYDSTSLDCMSMTDLFIVPLGPNWLDLPSNKLMPAVPPTFSYTQPPPPLMQPNTKSPHPLTQTVLETPVVCPNLVMPMQPDIKPPPPLTETPARSALAVSPMPAISPTLTVPTPAVSPTLTVLIPTISTPAVSPIIMVQTPAMLTPAISPTIMVPTPAISPTIMLPTPSISPTVTLPTPSASPTPTPAPPPTFRVPKQLDIKLPQPLTETLAVSTPAISPTLAVPIPAVSPTFMAPTQPELDIELTPPLTEPILPIIDAPPVQQIESLAFGQLKQE
ncbi:hypothetical protein BD769DRAFT_1672097 [Suillus cothurnatus]|nr:hypothetical protein BD769DRAFT_1672097 [Suillus cothurnatus]